MQRAEEIAQKNAHSKPGAGMTVGVVGCGRMGKIRFEMARRLGAEVAWIFDADETKANAMLELAPNAKSLTSITDIARSPSDVVFDCLPPAFRLACLEHLPSNKTALFVEKPLALNSSMGTEFVRWQKASGRLVNVGFMNRHRPSIQQLRRVLEQELAIGASMRWVGKTYGVDWWANESLSGGAINEQASHGVDILRFLFGRITSVLCWDASQESDGVTLQSILRFETGFVATFLYSCQAHEKDIGLSVSCAKTQFVLDGWDFDLSNGISKLSGRPQGDDRNSIFELETKSFFECVRNRDAGATCLSPPEDALETQHVTDAMQESLANGGEVFLTS